MFNATFDLSSLNGNNGFAAYGVANEDQSGNSVSNAGDVNGDGIDDVIIGSDPLVAVGSSYVVFGRNTGFSLPLELSALDGTNGFAINDEVSAGETYFSVSNAGDVNGDGIDDVILGALAADPGGRSNAGSSYVVFGRNTGFNSSLTLSALNGTNGFTINGIGVGDQSGKSVSYAGDVNDDGIDDVIVGAPAASPGGLFGAGASYIVFGKNTGFSPVLELSTLDGTNGFIINGLASQDFNGWSVSNAGDVNDDGIDDVILGVHGASPDGRARAGISYVVFGKNTGFSPLLDLSTLDGTNGFAINGVADSDLSGYSVSYAGDVNSDGIDDVVIGAAGASPGGRDTAGSTYVIFGKNTAFSSVLELSTLDGTNGFTINGVGNNDFSGASVSNVGDINADGFDDVTIGAYFASPDGHTNAGASYVVFGKNTGFSSILELSTLDGTNGFAINGVANSDLSGISVSGGDIDADGIDDIIIGAYSASPEGRADAGSSYVIFGQPIVHPSSAGTSGRGTVSAANYLESTLDNVLFSLGAGFFAHRTEVAAQNILENNPIVIPMLQG